jgi:hypothetical protein
VAGADCLVLLGAGASASLGYRPMAEFVRWVDDEVERAGPDVARLWTAFRTTLPAEQAGDLEELFGLISLLANPSTEAASAALKELDALGSEFEKVCRASVSLEKWLRRTVFEEYSRRQDYEAIDELYGPLLELVVERVRKINEPTIIQWQIPLYTTNYDPSLRDACARRTDFRLGTPVDGFGAEGQTWDRDWIHCGLTSPLSDGQATARILVVHLHGCVSWVRYPNGELRREASPAFLDNERELEHVNEVIYPHEKSFRQPEPYATHHLLLRRHLQQAAAALVIGFQFRKTDSLILDAFRQAWKQISVSSLSTLALVPIKDSPMASSLSSLRQCTSGGSSRFANGSTCFHCVRTRWCRC